MTVSQLPLLNICNALDLLKVFMLLYIFLCWTKLFILICLNVSRISASKYWFYILIIDHTQPAHHSPWMFWLAQGYKLYLWLRQTFIFVNIQRVPWWCRKAFIIDCTIVLMSSLCSYRFIYLFIIHSSYSQTLNFANDLKKNWC